MAYLRMFPVVSRLMANEWPEPNKCWKREKIIKTRLKWPWKALLRWGHLFKIIFIAPGNESPLTNSSPRRLQLVLDYTPETKTLMTDSRISENRPIMNPMFKFFYGIKNYGWLWFQILFCPWCLNLRVTKIDQGNFQLLVQWILVVTKDQTAH